jgi:hypothetical protein
MLALFAFSLILGGGLLAFSLLGDFVGGDLDVDTDVDADFDLDLDGGLDADAGAGDAMDTAELEVGSEGIVDAVRIFTIRNFTYFLFGFGAVGTVLEWLSPGTPLWLVTLAALVAGITAAGLAALTFGYVTATDSGALVGETSFVGCEARVTLPVRHDRGGQVVVQRGVREYELRALPFDVRAADPERWRRVVVVEMDGGTARVSPMEELASSDADPAAAT